MIQPINNTTTYTGNGDNDNKVRASEVGVVTGATAAGAKYSVSAFKRFHMNGKDAIALSGKASQQIKNAANATGRIKSLWGKMLENAKSYTNSIVKWAKSTATGKFAKKVVNSKAFGKCSAVIGGLGAMFVFISGIGEMGNAISRMKNED